MIKKILQHQFVSASFWVFLATGFLNVGNYFFHLIMGRMLGPAAYGTLESAISSMYIASIPLLSFSIIITKFVSEYHGRNEEGEVSGLYAYFTKKFLLFGTLVTLCIVFVSPLISSFLHLPSNIIAILLAINFFIGLFVILTKSVLQGVSKFLPFALVNIVEVVTKIFFAILLVYLGFHVEGAFFSFVLSAIICFMVGNYFISKNKVIAKPFTEEKRILNFSIPTFFSTLAITSLFTTDILLVRHFFPGEVSGYYAAVSVLGKVIFFAVSPLAIVMFPLVSQHHAKGTRYQHLLLYSSLITLFGALLIDGVFFLFPDLMVLILFGKKFLAIAPYVGIFGLFMTLYSLCALFVNFYLSIHKTKATFIVSVFAILQIVLISLYHQNLVQVIQMSILSVFLLLISLLLYYPYATKKS